MSEFLDTLKQRWVEAHQRYKEAQEALTAATARHTAAVAENNNWQKAFEMEKAREDQAAAAAAAATALANAGTSVNADVQVASAATADPATAPDAGKSDGNKTDMIRDLLRQHPGMTPSDLWDAAKGEISSRPYVYSILKRLKDREQVTVRRGKYYLRIPSKPEEAKPQVTVQ